MAHNMLKFTRVERAMPDKRSVEVRARDFDEIYEAYSPEAVADQAGRCSQCGVPFCQQGCPLHNNIPDWLMLAAEGRMEEAYRVSAATNNMPEVCGRICPQDRLCEGICTIEQSGHGTVTIGAVEKHITDHAWEQGWIEPIRPPRERATSPPGSSAPGRPASPRPNSCVARVTRSRSMTVMTAAAACSYTAFPASSWKRRLSSGASSGSRTAASRSNSIAMSARMSALRELRTRHESVLIATGVYKARDLKLPGVGHDSVVAALDYLTASNRKGFGDRCAGT